MAINIGRTCFSLYKTFHVGWCFVVIVRNSGELPRRWLDQIEDCKEAGHVNVEPQGL